MPLTRSTDAEGLTTSAARSAAFEVKSSVTPRGYQLRAGYILLRTERAIIKAPAGSGKTIIAAWALAHWLASFKALGGLPKVVWIANTKEQCDQARDACSFFPLIAERCQLVIGCYAGVPDCQGAVLVILDECHHIASPENRKCLDGCTGWRWGFSATPERADELAADVYSLIGPIACVIGREELVDDGKLAAAKVYFHCPNGPSELQTRIAALAEPLIQQRKRFWRNLSEEEIRKRTTWHFCQQVGIFTNVARNACIVRLANRHISDSVIILVGSIEHGGELAKGIKGAVVAHSKMGAKLRREAMADFRAGTLKCLIATSLADEGLDLPRANVMILAAGGRSAAKAEQRTGRVLRTWGEKTHGVIHDMWDRQHYFLLAQSKARKRVYESLGYKIEDHQSEGQY